MFNLNEKYFSISERCGRNHQNKFCLRPPKRRLCTWELIILWSLQSLKGQKAKMSSTCLWNRCMKINFSRCNQLWCFWAWPQSFRTNWSTIMVYDHLLWSLAHELICKCTSLCEILYLRILAKGLFPFPRRKAYPYTEKNWAAIFSSTFHSDSSTEFH